MIATQPLFGKRNYTLFFVRSVLILATQDDVRQK